MAEAMDGILKKIGKEKDYANEHKNDDAFFGTGLLWNIDGRTETEHYYFAGR